MSVILNKFEFVTSTSYVCIFVIKHH